MFDIRLGDGLRRQLKEQGYKFIADVNVSWFEEMSSNIDRLLVSGYVTKAEHERIRQRFFKDLKKFTTKIEE